MIIVLVKRLIIMINLVVDDNGSVDHCGSDSVSEEGISHAQLMENLSKEFDNINISRIDQMPIYPGRSSEKCKDTIEQKMAIVAGEILRVNKSSEEKSQWMTSIKNEFACIESHRMKMSENWASCDSSTDGDTIKEDIEQIDREYHTVGYDLTNDINNSQENYLNVPALIGYDNVRELWNTKTVSEDNISQLDITDNINEKDDYISDEMDIIDGGDK
jgi:hypothetical protein